MVHRLPAFGFWWLIGSVQPVSCNGGTNGAISLTAVGGVSPYQFTWSLGNGGPAITTQNLHNLVAGNYTVDANGATATAGYALTQPLPLTSSVLTTDAVCNGQTGIVTTEVRGETPDLRTSGVMERQRYLFTACPWVLTRW